MTKEQFIQACTDLEQLGYKRNFRKEEHPKGNGLNYFWKVIEWRKDKYGESRAVNQLLFKIWHFEEFKDRFPADSMYSLEPVIAFSRNTSERIDLMVSYPEHSIDELEELASRFGKWADDNIQEVND